MALNTKMVHSMKVDFSFSSKEVTAEGSTGKFKESSMFMVGGHQWKLCCYPTGMNDHQWMDVLDGIAIVLVPLHKSQMVSVSLLL
jgi:hypothetical protein